MKKILLLLLVLLSIFSTDVFAQDSGSKVCLRVYQKPNGEIASRVKTVDAEQNCPKKFKTIIDTSLLRGSDGAQGPAGEQGATGSVGSQGPAGAGGATFAAGSGFIRTDTTNYLPASGIVLVGGVTDEEQTQVLIPRTCTAGNFHVALSEASGGTKTFTFRVNGADSAITCTIADPATTCTSGNTAAITAGDVVAIEHVDVGSANDVNGYLGWTCL